MTSLENNGRPVVFRVKENLYASEGAEGTHQEQGRVPPAGQGGPRQEVVPALWVAPRAALWCPSAFRRVKIPRKFSSIPRIFPEVNFLKYKNSKNRKLALVILSIG